MHRFIHRENLKYLSNKKKKLIKTRACTVCQYVKSFMPILFSASKAGNMNVRKSTTMIE